MVRETLLFQPPRNSGRAWLTFIDVGEVCAEAAYWFEDGLSE